uniref:Uncharacterized protein LOC102804843 n=1 Tax=Saccoglossus kowalevskii TaxID=10224 RepID=A0ABM0MWM4_SACKO|nr:PREDICTED: uncharacterized protein LOC102804843 [Saccoglossus kowalevskii]
MDSPSKFAGKRKRTRVLCSPFHKPVTPQSKTRRLPPKLDTMNKYFCHRNADNVGTLFHAKQRFGHRAVKKNVMECYNHVKDFLNFYTDGMVCILAMKIKNMNRLDAKPNDLPTVTATKEQKEKYLKDLSSEIVNYVWPTVDRKNIKKVGELEVDDDLDDDREYCTCDGEGDVDSLSMIECSAQKNCECAQWYHFECVGLDEEDDLLEDWWCSDGCKKWSIYCCKRNREEEEDVVWIGCSNEASCINNQWFHLDCKGLKELPDGDWFCCQDCRMSFNDSEEMDSINEYSCAVTWRGLYHLANRDAERQNDGQAMISNWKINMLDFWNNNHNKYLILGHRLLSYINGFLPARLAYEMVWEATANLEGGIGKNIALDLVNEFLNNDFKQNLKHSRGQYTDAHVAWCSQIVGSLGKSLEKVYMAEVMDKYIPKSKTTAGDYRKHV